MRKKKHNSLMGVILSLSMVLLMCSSVAAQSFDPIFEWIKKFRNGEEIELKTSISDSSFTFFRSQTTNIDQASFNKLKGNSQSLSQIKILSDGKLEFGYEVSNLLRLEETFKEFKPNAWRKIEFVQIKSYPLKQWPDFLKQATSKGLMDYEIMEYEGGLYAILNFKQIDTSELRFGKSSIKFSDEFYNYMRISKEFKPRTSTVEKFAILVHEPHWLLAGQYQLIPGLKALIESNSQHKFRFLVEGYFEEENKYIPTKSTRELFSEDISVRTQAFTLLRNFLIDGPFAYRLIYNPDLPALAIDDPEFIKKTPREADLKDLLEQRKVLIRIIKKLEKIPQEKTVDVLKYLNLFGILSSADSSDLKGQIAIKFYSEIATLYDELSNKLQLLNAQDFKNECYFLSKQAKGYRVQTKIFEYALKRDTTMVKSIVDHFASKYVEHIPIVFIGNFHTPGIIEALPKQIGYVVLEPRISPLSTIPPKKERDNFNDALQSESRPSYLKKLSGKLKLRVAPSTKELPDYKSLLKKETSKINLQRNNFKTSSPLKSETTSRIMDALEQNGFLNNVKVSFAGGGGNDNIPPNSFQGSFGSFHYGPEGKNPAMIFYDRKEENWKRSDRFNFLKTLLLIPPYEKFKEKMKKVSFYQDKKTHRIFFWVFDPETQKFYLYEWEEGMDIDKLLPLPKTKGKEKIQIHFRLSIRELIYYLKGELNG
jgi:hypothetical protein